MDLFDEAVAAAVEETDALDWKAALPDKGKHMEFAKDVAAMANTGGGMIVYGVSEVEGPSSAAGHLDGVEEWGDAHERRLRQVAYNAVQPPVHGLSFRTVERDSVRVVALYIPSSPDAPHLVWAGSGFTAPLRYGAQTEFMRERDLERSYQARFRGRSLFRDTVEERLKQLQERLPAADQVWLTATAVPLQPKLPQRGRVSREVAQQVFSDLARANPFTVIANGPRLNANPSAALRRWTCTATRLSRDDVTDVAEVHDDGSVSLAAYRLASPSSDLLKNHLHERWVQEFVAHLVWLIRLTSRALQVDSPYALRVTLHSDMRGLYIRSVGDFDYVNDPDSVTRIDRFVPVETTIDPTRELGDLLEDVRELATDMMNQGGTATIGSRFIRESVSE